MSRNSQRGENQITTRTETALYQHQGPLPDAGSYERYNMVLPGAADRILRMAETEADHRRSGERKDQEINRKYYDSFTRDSLLGLVFGFTVAALCVVCGTYLVLQGHDVAGTIFGGSGLAGIAGVFVYSTRHKNK